MQRRLKLFTNIIDVKEEGVILLLLLFSISGFSQERFNIRYSSGLPFTILTNVIENDSGYMVMGFLGDGETTARPMSIAQFNFEGEYLFQNLLGGAQSELENSFFGSENFDIKFYNDTVYAHSGKTYSAEGLIQGYIMFSDHQGDSLSMIRFNSPHFGEGYDSDYFIATKRMEISSEGNFLVLSNIIGETTANDFMIQKMTPEGEILWTYEYATAQDPDICDVVLPTEDGGGVFFPRILEESISLVRKLNSEGLLMWEFNTLFDEWNGRVRDAIIEDDLIIAASSWNDDSEFGVIPSVLKFDTLGNFLWHTPVWQNDYSPNHKGRQIVKSQNGGYVLGGIHYDSSVEPHDKSAFLAKVSEEGELLWQRRYKHLDLDFDDHELYDLRATSDGGYIFCGESEDRWPAQELTEPPYQQGWLVKVDEHGCLVEGCHLSDTVSEIEVENKEYFKVGPIPASEYLNIYQAQQVSPLAVYELYDLQGKLVKSIPSADKNTTLMVDITDLSSGNYVLSLRERSKLLQSKKVTIR